MWKNLLKITDAYKTLPQEVSIFELGQIGSGWYIYAVLENGEQATVGRFKTYDEAESNLKALQSLLHSKK